MHLVLALLLGISAHQDSLTLGATARAAIVRALDETARDTSARHPNHLYIDVESFRSLLPGTAEDSTSWSDQLTRGIPQAEPRRMIDIWRCDTSRAQAACTPPGAGEMAVHAMKVTRNGPDIVVDFDVSWSLDAPARHRRLGVSATYEATIRRSADGYRLLRVERVPAVIKGR